MNNDAICYQVESHRGVEYSTYSLTAAKTHALHLARARVRAVQIAECKTNPDSYRVILVLS